MIDDGFEKLIWEEIDGTISPDDRRRLEARLAADEAARAHRRHLLSFNDTLAGLEPAETPADLRASIRRAIAARGQRPAPRPFWHHLVSAGGNARLVWLAAGLLIGAFVTLLVSQGVGTGRGVDDAALFGAMNVRPQQGAAVDLELADAAGRLRLGRTDAGLEATLSTASTQPLELTLVSAAGEMRLDAISQTAGIRSDVAVEGARAVARTEGRGELHLLLAGADGGAEVLSVRVSGGGRVLLDREIRVPDTNFSDDRR